MLSLPALAAVTTVAPPSTSAPLTTRSPSAATPPPSSASRSASLAASSASLAVPAPVLSSAATLTLLPLAPSPSTFSPAASCKCGHGIICCSQIWTPEGNNSNGFWRTVFGMANLEWLLVLGCMKYFLFFISLFLSLFRPGRGREGWKHVRSFFAFERSDVSSLASGFCSFSSVF
ncbi:hypothetical protein QC763_305630 [Podospora pseudopauciseta]|uniref:Hydrophobin n=1 Tax=Podospora pseudopauciseta TaxID=2093780 RepID=A0ABR0HGE3_9PEZI|nr:hypothetical protein QC763_305630 [Podospora pseudopauciseta]